MLLLDTNVISEPTAKRPDARVMAWLAAQESAALFLSAITLGELRRGILLLDAGRKKRGLLAWLENEIKPAFAGRILAVDAAVMEKWAALSADARKQGRDARSFDLIIAAIALVHDFTFATRNTADFTATGVRLVNPWMA
jgi:predicted nucleic acid-binding protein